MIIIQHATTGEVQAVSSLDGYGEDWVQIGADRAPLPNESWTNGAWVLDEARAAEQDELAEITDRQRLRAAFKAARNRIVTLENRQTQLIDAVQALQARVDILEGN